MLLYRILMSHGQKDSDRAKVKEGRKVDANYSIVWFLSYYQFSFTVFYFEDLTDTLRATVKATLVLQFSRQGLP